MGVSRERITDGEWHHVALVIDNESGLWTAYLDGVSSGEDGNENGWMTGEGGGMTALFDPGVSFDNQDELLLGAGVNGVNPFSGRLDDFAVWGRALSEAEILAIFNGGPISRLDGDINGDGIVGSADLDAVRSAWGQTITTQFAFVDCNHDGRVGSADLDMVRANWGNTGANAVPEPSSMVLLLAVPGLVVFRIRRRRMA